MYELTTFSLGTKPVPRIWDKWNFKGLEPKDMRKDEQIKQDASKGVLKASLLKKSTAVDNTSHWQIQGRGPSPSYFETKLRTYHSSCYRLRAVSLFRIKFRFLGNWPPTPPLSHHFALSEK